MLCPLFPPDGWSFSSMSVLKMGKSHQQVRVSTVQVSLYKAGFPLNWIQLADFKRIYSQISNGILCERFSFSSFEISEVVHIRIGLWLQMYEIETALSQNHFDVLCVSLSRWLFTKMTKLGVKGSSFCLLCLPSSQMKRATLTLIRPGLAEHA